MLLFAGFISFGFCLIYFLAVKWLIGSREHEGLFGDMFGGINALFSGLALIGAIYAVLMQREELELQREEMKRSNTHLANQTEALRAQLEAMDASIQLERRRDREKNKPVFKLIGKSSGPNRSTLRFINIGARISDVSALVLEPTEGISVHLNHHAHWEAQEPGTIEVVGFGGNPCPECVFVLNFTDRMGDRVYVTVHLPADGGSPRFLLD